MAREMILRCNLCGNQMEQAAAKIYLVPKKPGTNPTYLSAYSASGDICSDCIVGLDDKLDKRKRRANGQPKHARTSRKKTTK